ncbi:MAG: hypothetical protein WC100_02545 [Sterolibacterium sp.]
MTTKDTGGNAFPCDTITPRDYSGCLNGPQISGPGMTLRQYAAIKLKVPDSGADWLDAMIVESLRDDLAAKAMQGQLASDWNEAADVIADWSYKMAGAMLDGRK